jgi:hypothetical protein
MPIPSPTPRPILVPEFEEEPEFNVGSLVACPVDEEEDVVDVESNEVGMLDMAFRVMLK